MYIISYKYKKVISFLIQDYKINVFFDDFAKKRNYYFHKHTSLNNIFYIRNKQYLI